ncbi:MAG TPA: toxin-antitoxin system HicB family antitoxin [Spirochaetia bacterium]|nr:toxin-antitoxin system HicB family antitoxin [Spirochaetia bacterium]
MSDREKKRFLLRLDSEVHEALERWSAEELRSLNGQIEYVLREALVRVGRLPNLSKDSDRP